MLVGFAIVAAAGPVALLGLIALLATLVG